MTLDDYYIVGDRETAVQAITEYVRATGLFDVITVKFVDTDRRSIRWMRSYRYIEWQIPTAMLRLDTEHILDVVAGAMEVVRGGSKRPLMPQTVFAMRTSLGWTLPLYDEMGMPLPEAPAPAEEGSA